MPGTKRQRFDWTHKVDPETGAALRFCSRCKDYLPLVSFYACHIKLGALLCKEHAHEIHRPLQRRYRKKKRGEPGSVARLLSNVNRWIYLHRLSCDKWTASDVEAALERHGVDLKTESRTVQLRPCDPDLPFTVDNSRVSYRNSGSGNRSNPI